jgi:hypothetical protein
VAEHDACVGIVTIVIEREGGGAGLLPRMTHLDWTRCSCCAAAEREISIYHISRESSVREISQRVNA